MASGSSDRIIVKEAGSIEKGKGDQLMTDLSEIRPGMFVEAKDKYDKWFPANVLEISQEKQEVLVHFRGWSSRFDEWVDLNGRLRKVASTPPKRGKASKSFQIGDRVQAKWEDNRLYYGQVVGLNGKDHLDVLFDDGIHFSTPITNVRKKTKDKMATAHSTTKKQGAKTEASSEAREKRVLKRRKEEKETDNSLSQSDTFDNSSPPSSPLVTRRRRRHKIRSMINTSDEDHDDFEYIISEEDEDETEFSSANETDVSTTTDNTSPIRNRRRRGSARGRGRGSRGTGKARGRVPKSSKEGVSTNELKVKGVQEKVSIASGSKKKTQSSVTSDESLVACKTLGPLLTPPPHHFSPTVTVTPIALVSTPQTIIQTHSHTISGIELLPSGSESGTHITTVEGVPCMELMGQTPPTTPLVSVTAVSDNKQNERGGLSLKGRGRSLKSEALTSPSTESTVAVSTALGETLVPTAVAAATGEGKMSNRERRKRKALPMATRTQKRVEKNIIKNDDDRPSHLAPKEHVIVWDHNSFKCTFVSCSKSFRKESLLKSHLRHYHKQKSPQLQKGIKKNVEKTTLKSSDSSKDVTKPTFGGKTTKGSQGNSSILSSNSPDCLIKRSPKSHLLSPKKKSSKSPSASAPAMAVREMLITKMLVPPQVTAKVIYKEMKLTLPDPVDLVRVDTEEPPPVRHRSNLRPVRRASNPVPPEAVMETESEETEETEEEEEEETTEEDEEFSANRKQDKKRSTTKDDVVHCNCDNNLDEGFMIQCDQCLTWQHGECVGIMEGLTPESYLCPVCSNPPGVRQRIKQMYPRMWFVDGTLPTFSRDDSANISPKNQRAVLKSHKLADILYKIKKMVHCTKIKLQAVNNPSHSYLKQWSRHCKQLSVSEIQTVLMNVLAPVKDKIPLPSVEHNGLTVSETSLAGLDTDDLSLARQDEPYNMLHHAVTTPPVHPCSLGETLMKEPFPDVKNLRLVPLPPPVMSPSTQQSQQQDVTSLIDLGMSSSLPSPTQTLPPPALSNQTISTNGDEHSTLVQLKNESICSNGHHSLMETAEIEGVAMFGEGGGQQGLSSRDVELSAAVKQAAVSIAAGETGNQWLQRVLLIQHIDQVQQRILSWMDIIDKQIEGLCESELSDTGNLLAEVQQTILELDKIRRTVSSQAENNLSTVVT